MAVLHPGMGLVSSIQPLAAAEMTDRDLTGGAERQNQQFTTDASLITNLITAPVWNSVGAAKGIYRQSEGVPTTLKWRLPVSEVKGCRRLVEYKELECADFQGAHLETFSVQ